MACEEANRRPQKRIDQVYFIEAGFASIVADGTSKPSIEVGIIGREGMTGLGIVLGNDRAPHERYMQVAGRGLRISAAKLRAAGEGIPTLHRAMLRSAHAFLHQTTTTELANGRSKMEERLARWSDNRLDGNELPLTHRVPRLDAGNLPALRKPSRHLRRKVSSPSGATPSPSSIAQRSKSGRTARTSRRIIRRTPSM
jgi:hypothetical protein